MGGIATVAARIRDRALQLEATRTELRQAQTDLDQAKTALSSHRQINSSVRADMLEAVRSRHGVELELLKVEQQTGGMEDEIAAINEEAEQTRQATAQLRGKYARIETDIYARHEVEVGTYRLAAEDVVKRQERKRRKRERRLDDLALKADQCREEASAMERECTRLRDVVADMDGQEEREDEEVAALAMQIRATLKKKSSLRAALQEAKDRHREANEYMLRWEKEITRYGRS